MPSFQIAIEPNRRAAARFVGQVRRSLQKAFVEEQNKRGLSQSDIARALKIHRSVINRELKGVKDITLGRIGELAWAMGRRPSFSMEETVVQQGMNIPITGSAAAPTPHSVAVSQPVLFPGIRTTSAAAA